MVVGFSFGLVPCLPSVSKIIGPKSSALLWAEVRHRGGLSLCRHSHLLAQWERVLGRVEGLSKNKCDVAAQ